MISFKLNRDKYQRGEISCDSITSFLICIQVETVLYKSSIQMRSHDCYVIILHATLITATISSIRLP